MAFSFLSGEGVGVFGILWQVVFAQARLLLDGLRSVRLTLTLPPFFKFSESLRHRDVALPITPAVIFHGKGRRMLRHDA